MVFKTFASVSPIRPKVSGVINALRNSARPMPNPSAALNASSQFMVVKAPFIASFIALPKLSQWKFHTKLDKPARAVFIASPIVLPISVNSPGVSKNPFKNVAILFAIFLVPA